MVNKTGLKMKTLSIRVVVVVFAFILMALGLAGAGIWDVSNYIIPIVKLGAVMILFIEIGLISVIQKIQKIDFIKGVEIVIGALVALEVVLMLFGSTWATLSNLSGWILFIFGIVFAVEAFVRD